MDSAAGDLLPAHIRTLLCCRKMLYPDHFIDDLKNRADLVQIIRPYAQDLKKRGANWMACCPFHSEKTPSFSVNPAKGFYKCFGCGKGGSVFTFLMDIEGLAFPEAVKRVAELTGVMLPEPVDDKAFQTSKKKRAEQKAIAEQVIELNQVALEFWQKELAGRGQRAKLARKYLEGRGISQEVCERFAIGFAPQSWNALLDTLRDFGADDTLILKSGLVSQSEKNGKVFDRFRGRIMFPVLDIQGRPVAFGARSIDPEDQPKYLNSPETPAYTKGEHLYGLFNAREAIRKANFAILVEGYLDLIALDQFGIVNVAASLGTAFTEAQAKLLHRFTDRVVINYDGDTAGVKAARRAIENLLPLDFDIKVLVLPDGSDPDDFIRKNGADAYKAARGKAEPFLSFTMRNAAHGLNLNRARQKAEAIENTLPVIAAIGNNIQRRVSFDAAMAFFQIEDADLKKELWASLSRPSGIDLHGLKQHISRSARAKATVAERRLLELMIADAEVRASLTQQLEPSDHEDLATAEIFAAVLAIETEKETLDRPTLFAHLGNDEASIELVGELIENQQAVAANGSGSTLLAEAQSCLRTLRVMAIEARIMAFGREAVIAEESNNHERLREITEEQLKLEKLRRELKHNKPHL